MNWIDVADIPQANPPAVYVITGGKHVHKFVFSNELFLSIFGPFLLLYLDWFQQLRR
jgi:hypothetical protein